MEKIVTLLWRPDGQTAEEFANELREKSMPRLQELGAEKLKLCVEDDAVAAGAKRRTTPVGLPKAAFVSYWIELAQDRGPLEAVLANASANLMSFLVVESQPIVNTKHVVDSGERTPGFSQVTCVLAKQSISYDEFIKIWHEEQRPCAIETQSTFQYVRNEIVRCLTGAPPPWAAIVEEGFPIGALEDDRVFYDAGGDEEKFQANHKRMMDTGERFLEMPATDVTTMSEYVYAR